MVWVLETRWCHRVMTTDRSDCSGAAHRTAGDRGMFEGPARTGPQRSGTTFDAERIATDASRTDNTLRPSSVTLPVWRSPPVSLYSNS
jgi:hypothetical protein